MTKILYDEESVMSTKREKIVLAILLALVGLLTVLDVFEDVREGSAAGHIIPEVVIILSVVLATLLLFRTSLNRRTVIIEQARQEINNVKRESTTWRLKAQTLSKGISDAISEQLNQWSLTPAEREISFLLLKGLTIQEISRVRQTSERTIRQQASEIYKKSGLSGRIQLSAFFLEDLFDRS